ncbi:hypothetical protein [Marilutibacter aestuarii]|uniref:J domain-containing protein n=1 Tax=Marilutibacter aestuarii TaxID=1706195 RepID=A0A508AM27_9GAMM|nr:hypothetical protein [Lysobacter aestuarii]TQD49641.1 hypothetical protein FKV25_04405 [Lysobacter aestuarii]
MWAFAELGLDAGADVRAVKRAYAARLKTTRPDTDPEGFQRLHAAYQAALAAAQADAPARGPATPPGVEPSPPPPPPTSSTDAPAEVIDDTDEPALEAFDADAFLAGCIEQLVRGEPGDVRRWLEAQPALWSLQLKGQLGYWLLNQLHERSPPVAEENLDALLAFFDLDHVLSGVDPDALMHLRSRLGFRRDLQPGRERALGRRIFPGRPAHDRHAPALRMMRQLRRPLRWAQVLAFAVPSRRSLEMRHMVLALDDGDLDSLGDVIDLRQARFWLAAGDASRQSTPRRLVALARCLVAAACMGAVSGLVHWLTGDLPGRATLAPAAGFGAATFGYALVGLYVAWEAWVAVAGYFNWQSAADDVPTPRPMLRLFWVPLLAALAWLLSLLPAPHDALAMSAGSLAALTGLVRCFRRAGLRLNFRGWRLILLIPFLKGLAGLAAIAIAASGKALGLGLAGTGLLLWSVDAWRQRASWWPMLRVRLPWRASAEPGR